MQYCSVNYQIKLENEASISINERGFLFGDGIFETCRIKDGKIDSYQSHLNRLKLGLEAIKIDFDLSKLEENTTQLITKNNLKEGIVRIYISRGNGSIGYLPKPNIKPLIIIQTKNLPKKPTGPINLWVSKLTKISNKSLPVSYKLAQGLNSTLAKIEAQENNCFDSLLLNDKGEICETSSANIFWVKDNILYTPHKDCGLLLGTVRQKIIDLSPIEVKEVKFNLDQLLLADEIFITNVSYKILQINQILPNNQQLKGNKYFITFDKLLSMSC